MARPRTFDMEEALERALDVFWAKGYAAASLDDLLRAMGIARGSLYKAFADKRALYLAALDHYGRTRTASAVAELEAGTRPGLERIARVFDTVLVALARGDRRGCFVCNAAVDQASHDPDVAARVRALVDRLEQGFATALGATDRWVAAGPQVVSARAKELAAEYLGLRVLSKTGLGEREMAGRIKSVLSDLEPGPALGADNPMRAPS